MGEDAKKINWNVSRKAFTSTSESCRLGVHEVILRIRIFMRFTVCMRGLFLLYAKRRNR